MRTATDAFGVGFQPVYNHNQIWSLFFIVYYFVSNIMVFNAFTGVMVQKFNEISAKYRKQATVFLPRID